MDEGLRIALVGCGVTEETLRVSLLAECGANQVGLFPRLSGPVPLVGAAPPDLAVVGVPDDPERLYEILKPLLGPEAAPGPRLALLSPHPYPFQVKMAASYHRVAGVLRLPPDPLDVALLLKSLRAARASGARPSGGSATEMVPDPETVRKFRHDANNFLGQVMTGVSLLDDDACPPEFRAVVSRALDSCDHLGLCLARFAAYAGPLSPLSAADPGEPAREAIRRASAGRDDERIAYVGPEHAPPLMLREGDLSALLEELLRNALEAGDGPVELRLSSDECRAVYEVLDRGPGFDPAAARRARWFTTKNRTYHKGIGLPLAERLAARTGATLAFSPREGGGTVVRVELSPRGEASV